MADEFQPSGDGLRLGILSICEKTLGRMISRVRGMQDRLRYPDADPEYADMPGDKPLLTLHWEDVVNEADAMKLKLTRGQIIEIFDGIEMSDGILDAWWDDVAYRIREAVGSPDPDA